MSDSTKDHEPSRPSHDAEKSPAKVNDFARANNEGGAAGADQPADEAREPVGQSERHQAAETRVRNQLAKVGNNPDITEPDKDQAADEQAVSPTEQEAKQPEPNRAMIVLGRALVTGTFLLTVAVAVSASMVAMRHPRTDDAEVFANFIGMAPLVDGPIVQLSVRDNQQVHAGDLLFVIDDRPYRYALERALSNQKALEGQVKNERRHIYSEISGVHVATANISSSASNRNAMGAEVDEAKANLVDAEAADKRNEAELHYAEDNLHRLEPLLAQQFVTADQVDQARTLVETRSRAVQQAIAHVALMEAGIRSNQSRFDQSSADVEQRQAQRDQAANGVETIEPLTNQREERSAAVQLAQYNLDNCRVYAPFDGYITNLTTSLGAYVHTGNQVFTMIDDRTWWVIANFRETQLSELVPGTSANVFLMAHNSLLLHGVVESIGFGVTPDPSVAGEVTPGLPAVERTLSWVHLAARYPVRIRIEAPPPNMLRIGQTAVAVVHPARGAER